ncbi:pyridoxal phosphate-dependent aminotransferase [Streptococcus hyovaginalis]|uniref:pyridoxal phosphate-dependent aminotransferase n=1 Tax=Streptococcus hyovaginalis TaxID=149015 RepID=UPI001478E4E0|nr:pyridoxal phosphate-dependent aminotransferase [Streptococcus hyovaginalis]MDY3024745.1 pyridoxal phosphate-dependent aminotransferase [Streptococcus hyovaginalis]MDY4510541.1 pyridoxal phosphate-dependent aminotransferase [Streptococcus hyovaginalis]MDY5974803.1 pyridoxal phosphate-dependent aminotransferase [Streptococcus hyovaginalis]
MVLANRITTMQESVTLASGARAKALKDEGRDILNLTLGQPDFQTPQLIKEKAIEAIANDQVSFYTPASGLPELKDAIATYMKTFYGYEVTRDQILAATGAKFVLYAYFMTVLNPGDEVIIPTPYWVSYADQVKLAEGTPVFVETSEETRFKATVSQLEAARTEKTKVFLLNSPSNPTGMIYTKEELLAIGDWALEHDILILSDDIYGRLVYNDNTFVPISSLSEALRQQTMVVNGVAKTYSMTGWRVGFAVGDPELIAGMSKMLSQTTSNLTTVAQYAAIEALAGDQTAAEEMRRAFEERLNTIYPLLAAVPGFEVIKPEGAFYLFPNVKKAMEMKGFEDVTDFTNDILEKAGVALVTGAGFGVPYSLRMSYATDLETLKAAISRLQDYMAS